MTIGNNKDRHGMHKVSPDDANLSTEEQNYRKFKKIIENSGGSLEMLEEARDRRDITSEQCFELFVFLSQRDKLKLEEKNRRLEEENEILKEQVNTNPTTKLLNHIALETKLTNLISELKESGPKSGALMVFAFDIDNVLKEINNKYGHTGGNELLEKFGKHLSTIIKSGDLIAYPDSFIKEENLDQKNTEEGIVAHPHGDEFRAVLCIKKDLSNLTPDNLKSFFEGIYNRIKDRVNTGLVFSIGGEQFNITTSVGYSVGLPGGNKNAEELIDEADVSEREDKKRRKGQEDYSI